MAEEVVVPKDREQYWGSLEAGEMIETPDGKGVLYLCIFHYG